MSSLLQQSAGYEESVPVCLSVCLTAWRQAWLHLCREHDRYCCEHLSCRHGKVKLHICLTVPGDRKTIQ